ncbi:TolC family protein [Pseudanabaena galeata UHCC 0370]|uniref:TolC family protein n=1 Tax=Pseudanabaena galeata UHCC 0370 TaxID=3110310 RepID=A0ABU5TSR3_9CYAN|nr:MULTISPECIES: TolC family protein [Pseudanabaena]MEA5480523.1 TolC family protein [Pseudanabaena galeata UHCC 0370]MEA5488419.1 TolC family protein [Pseudanabaena sp. CCNP1317]WGS70375.1 TolC family protein [Pseudanabaena galeata CCNP1313]
MRISSSWLTLGASLSLLIPAWTANAQEFTMPLTPYTKVVLEPDDTTQYTSLIASEVKIPAKVDSLQINTTNAGLISNQKPILQDIQLTIAALPKGVSPDKSILPASESTILQDSLRAQPEKVSSSTEPARVIPSSAASNSGQLDPAQTLVVPTTPSQVKLDITKPVSLAELLDLVEKTNSDAIRARIVIERARAVLQEAETLRSPTVTGSVQYSYSDSAQVRLNSINNNTPLGKTTSNPLTGTIGVDYNIFDSGAKDAAIRIAENNLRIAEADLSRIRQNIRLSIVSGYYNLQNTDETIRIQRKAVENAERSLKDTKARERAGVGTKFDVLQSEVQLANAKQDLLNAEAAQLVARRELSRQLNYPAIVEITAADKIAPVPEWKLPIEETILLAVRNRAELDIRKLEREVARDRANSSLAQLGPRVNLFGNFNTASEFTSGSGIGVGYQVGARLDWNLYDGGRAVAQVNQFKADQAIAETRFEQDARQARYDVEESYINQRSRFQQIETATKAVASAEEALRLARLRLDAGVGTQLEVITAESDRTRAEVNRLQAIIGYNQSRANLERAISGL